MDLKNLPDHLYIMNQSQVLDSLSSKMSTWKHWNPMSVKVYKISPD